MYIFFLGIVDKTTFADSLYASIPFGSFTDCLSFIINSTGLTDISSRFGLILLYTALCNVFVMSVPFIILSSLVIVVDPLFSRKSA